jgi:hypothetical protein
MWDLMFVKLVVIEWFNGSWSYDLHNWNVQLSPLLVLYVVARFCLCKMEVSKEQQVSY